MSYLNKSITEIHNALTNKEITGKDLVGEAIKKSHEINKDLNAFVTICDDVKENNDLKTILGGIPYACKDNLSTKGILTTASSNCLKDYIPFFDATVIEKLQNAGAVMVNKTVMDEFGMGGTATTGHTGVVKNPWDITKMTAGSSGGSAAAVAAGVVPFSIGSDTGDSVRKPAAWCGIVGYKPTYGMISRHGLFPFASSMDHIGVFARNVEDAAIVIDHIKGLDEKDMTSWDSSKINLTASLNKDVKSKKLFYIKEICDINNYPNPSKDLKETMEKFKETIIKCQELGIIVEEVSIDRKLLNVLPATYITISCAEATSNMANMTGIIFGPRGNGEKINEIMMNHRTNGFSPLTKRRFVIGSYVLQKENQEKFFLNAGRIRRLIVNKMNELFETYDGLILPCSEGGAKPIKSEMIEKESIQIKVLENHMFIGNAGGFPSITIPNGFVNNLPIGINITGKIMDDENILNIAYKLEETMPYKNQIAKGWE